jgi:hypothetical protein
MKVNPIQQSGDMISEEMVGEIMNYNTIPMMRRMLLWGMVS